MNGRLFSVILALVAILPGCFLFGGTGSDPCDTSSSCGTCASRGGCGWCGSSASCRTGSSSGPDVGSCSGWVWLPSACGTTPPPDAGRTDTGTPPPTGCAASTNCGDCTGGATCGWCAADGRCYDGSRSGPNGTSCAAGWAWLSSECTTTPPPDAGCTPNCAGRACGGNGCGGTCGSCSTGESCDASGQCQPVAADHACAHVTCPGSYTCTWNISGVVNHYDTCCADGGSADWAMCGYPQTAGGVTQCERSIGAPADQVCHVAPATMHCDLPLGSIDCPGLWIETQSDGTDWYFTGCCGDDTTSDPSGNVVSGLHCGIANGPTGDCFPSSFSPTARPAM